MDLKLGEDSSEREKKIWLLLNLETLFLKPYQLCDKAPFTFSTLKMLECSLLSSCTQQFK